MIKLNKIYLKDKKIFDKYLQASAHELSVFSFANIYLWSKLYRISWAVIDGNLCVFFTDKIGTFLYLPPLGPSLSLAAVREAFQVMRSLNFNPEISRIENIEEKDLILLKELGYKIEFKFNDYLCLRQDLVDLSGNKFKSKRASCNYFLKNNRFKVFPYSGSFKKDCFKLFDLWCSQRKENNQDRIYQGMIEDSGKCLEVALNNFTKLGLRGLVVKTGKKVKGFTFGYQINPETFCVLFEITDLKAKGLAQFIFREFSSQLKGYKHINIMDDSGLENLKKVKQSYHPVKLIPAYIAKTGTVLN